MSIFNKFKKEKKVAKETEIKVEEGPCSPALESLPAGRPAYRTGRQARSSALLIKQAWVTEKAGDLSKLKKYTFIVDRKANKSEIKKAIESIYGVKVTDINIIHTKGKAKRLGRSLGKTSAFKKAIATLKEGGKIDVMPT